MLRHIAAAAVLLAAMGCGRRGSSELSSELAGAIDNRHLSIGSATTTSAKLVFDPVAEQFVYGAHGTEGAATEAQKPTHVSAAYEAHLNARTGALQVKRHDAQEGLTLTSAAGPLSLRGGIERSGSVIYAAASGDSAVVLTPRANGVKEDIVLTHALGDRLVFEWNLALDPGLEARLDSHGSVNVYGPSGDQILYRIPAPVVRDASGNIAQNVAVFELRGSRLTLRASGLAKLAYPISIDPTVLVTLTAEFALGGNNEGSADVSGDQVKRGRTLKGVGAWAATTAFPTARYSHASVAYNGYLYVIGGYAGVYLTDVQFAPLNANGTVGAWTATTSYSNGREHPACVAYNGFLYVMGGGGAGYYNDVQVAPINSNGTLGTWAATTSFPTGRFRHATLAYNGYLYVIGGMNGGGTVMADVWAAPINADGTVGAWASTTAFPTARYGHTSVAFNGFLYVIGGNTGALSLNDVQVARLNTNGTVGAWASATAFPTARYVHTSVATSGFLYVIGGSIAGQNDVQIAQLNANGTVGSWSASTAFATARGRHASVAYNGYLYVMGGRSGAVNLNDVQVAPLNQNGMLGPWTATTAFTTARSYHASAAYNGYLYVTGGSAGGSPFNDVQVAPLNPDGTVGAFVATTALPTARAEHSSLAVNGYLYVIGGYSGGYLNEVQVAPINADGTVGVWTATTALPAPRGSHASVAHNGFVYVIGGFDGTYLSSIISAPINAGGMLGTWTATTTFPTARLGHSSVAYDGFLYVLGGSSSASYLNDVEVAPINSNGTVGAWSATTSFSNNRFRQTSVAHNGYLYVIGGNNGVTAYNDVQAAPLYADGTVGPFATTSAFATGRRGHASVVANGNAYVIGGTTGPGYLNDVQVASLGSSGTVGTWTATTAFATPRSLHTSLAYNGYLYVIGGFNPPALSDVQVAPLNADGTVGAWTTTTAFPTARYGHASVAYNGFLYVLGGYGSTYLSDVRVARINSNGTLGAWAATTSFPTARNAHASVAYNGHLYVLGGNTGPTRLNDVLVAPVNPDGTLGAWALTTAFPVPRASHTSVAYNGYLYVVGGYDAGRFDDVQVAPMNADGTVGAWTSATSFQAARYGHLCVAVDGFLYVAGGWNGVRALNDVQVAPINANGTLGTWSGINAFTTGRYWHSGAAANGYLYVLGGAGGPGNDVQFTPLLTPAAKGVYSKQVDLGSASTVDTVTVSGTASYQGAIGLQYRVAGTTGVYGALIDKGFAPLGAAVALGDANVRYIWLRFSLDDTHSALVNPDAVNARDMSDFTVAYTSSLCVGVTCTPLDACHDVGTCDSATGVCSNPVRADGSACSDGDACTQSDSCQSGTCASGTPVACAALDSCHVAGTCSPATGLCSNPNAANGTACDDANACTQSDTCQSGTCTGANPVTCAAVGQCHVAGTCDTATGTCSNPNEVDGSACDDSNACTQTDTCQAGACAGANPIVCLASDQCHLIGTCDVGTGICSDPIKSNGAACDDANACTSGETCQSGSCGTPASMVTCTAQDSCHDVGVCDTTTGACSNPSATDGTICSGGVCVSGTCAAQTDAGDADAGDADAGAADAGATDAGAADAGVADAGASDAGVADAGASDAGAADAGATDAGAADAGAADAGVADAGVADAGAADAGAADSGVADGGPTDGAEPDSGVAGGDAGPNGGAGEGPVSGGCGCRTGGGSSGSESTTLLLFLGVSLLLRRRGGRPDTR